MTTSFGFKVNYASILLKDREFILSIHMTTYGMKTQRINKSPAHA